MASASPRGKQLKRALTFMKKDESYVKTPIFKGYMYKEAIGTFHTAFNKRYFVLYDHYLVYYEKEQDYLKDAKLSCLEHRHGAIRLDRLYLSKPEAKPKGGKYCFILHAPDKSNKRHEYMFVAKTRDERREWMTKLQGMNPKLLPHDIMAHISPDTPLPPRKIRSDSFVPSTELPDLSKLSITSEDSVPDNETEDHELELHEGDSDHEYHEPIEEEENGHHNNKNDDCVTISVPIP